MRQGLRRKESRTMRLYVKGDKYTIGEGKEFGKIMEIQNIVNSTIMHLDGIIV